MNWALVLILGRLYSISIGSADIANTDSLSPLITAALNLSQNAFIEASAPNGFVEPTPTAPISAMSTRTETLFIGRPPIVKKYFGDFIVPQSAPCGARH